LLRVSGIDKSLGACNIVAMGKIDIFDKKGTVIGELTHREITSEMDPAEWLPPLMVGSFPIEGNRIIRDDVFSKIDRFPIIEVTNIQIPNKKLRRNGDGTRAMVRFFAFAKAAGYRYAIVMIGKRSLQDSLENNTDFYVKKNGWTRFVMPNPTSPRLAYYDLSEPTVVQPPE
jgi:hypothetical protein